LDENRVLLDGPCSGVAREVYPLKRLSITDLKVTIYKGARTGTVTKAWNDNNIGDKWTASSWGKKHAQHKRRAELTDFDRFSVMIHRKRRAFLIRHSKK
jgi:large subunit ribosomal protein L14e